MQFLEAEINELTQTVWETVLALPITPSEPFDDLGHDEETVSACVHISGGWAGSLVLTCPTALGTKVAGAMFELEPDDVDEELLYDAVGEVANMIGGNVKGLVPGPSQLSLPAIARGIHTRLAVPGSHTVTRVSFCSDDHAVRVVLLQVDEANAARGDRSETAGQNPIEAI